MTDKQVLKEFLELPLWNSEDVFEKFRYHLKSIFSEDRVNPKKRFLYIEGFLREKVLLVAHADTFFDKHYGYPENDHEITEKDGYFTGEKKNGIGADDRAGCAMLYLLRDSGHSILITDGEEQGQTGSRWLMEYNYDIADRINDHQFMIQLDLKNAADFKCYSAGTDSFREFIQNITGYTEPNRDRGTDIVRLCRDITGVNFSIGYYDEHTTGERINIREWENTLNMIRKLLSAKLPRFPLRDK